MHLLYIQTLFQKINITMTIYLIIEKIFIINSLRFKQHKWRLENGIWRRKAPDAKSTSPGQGV